MDSAPAWPPRTAGPSSTAAAPTAASGCRPDGLTPPGRLPLLRLTKRREFLRAAEGRRAGAPSLSLQCVASPEAGDGLRIGYTASKKVGNAVQRNRAKRRMRAAAAAVLPLAGRAGHDYVLIARPETVTRPYAGLLDDLRSVLERVHRASAPRPERP